METLNNITNPYTNKNNNINNINFNINNKISKHTRETLEGDFRDSITTDKTFRYGRKSLRTNLLGIEMYEL